jgi:transcriptional regulator with XRE-family HTH domain
MILYNFTNPLSAVDVNLRYLCWKVEKDRSKWPAMLGKWIGEKRGADVAVAVLSGHRPLNQLEIGSVVSALDLDEHEFVYGNLPIADEISFVAKNLERLTSNASGQTKIEFAREIGVSPVTISRWIGGTQVPDLKARRMIALIFGLRDESDLGTVPIFLSFLPVTYGEQVAWINASMQEMIPAELRELFPALYRIFAKFESTVSQPSVKEQSLNRLRRMGVKKH